MNPNPNQNKESSGISPRDSFNLIHYFASIHAICLTPFFRFGYGSEGIGFKGPAGMVLILLVGSAKHSIAMFYFMLVWFAALIFQRVVTGWQWMSGDLNHSQYEGFPWIAMRVFKAPSEKVARLLIEPMLCFLVGAVLRQLSETLGGFFIAGAFSLFVKSLIDYAGIHARLRKMRDARIEQQFYSEKFRGW